MRRVRQDRCLRSRIVEPLSGGCLPEAAKKCASACGLWRRRVKTTPLTCRVSVKTRVCCTKSPARAISAMCQHTLARFLATTDEKGSDLESAPAWTAVGACARKPRVAPGVRGSVCTCRGRVVRPVGHGRRRLLPPTDAVALFSSPRPGRWLWSVRVCRRCFPFGLPFLAGAGCCRFNTPSLILPATPDSRTFSLAVSV